ncbi:MAG: chloride channel protein [Bacteroidales bacterium]|nr:chloride channel protein [Bacteroidales bacterium]
MRNIFKKIPERNKLLLLSLVVGITSGLAAVLLRWLIELIKDFQRSGFAGLSLDWQYLVLPGIGMLISLLLVKFVVRDDIGHGVTKVLYAVSRNESRIKPHNIWSSILTSSITIGFGGSVGAEAPIVYTGAALGSNIGRVCGLSHRSVTVLLGCGAAGAVAGIFKAPLAGVLFTMEILLFNVSLKTMLPLLISTVSASVVAYAFDGQDPMFACTLTRFSMENIPFYLILGLVSGFAALYFTGVSMWLEDRFASMKNCYVKWVVCSVLLGFLIFLFPPLYGEGYGTVEALLNGGDFMQGDKTVLGFVLESRWGLPCFFLLVFLCKVLAMTFTNAGGGVGGTFGPTLFAGAILGFAMARCMNNLGAGVPEQNFVLVGMAALMASVMQAPMTAIFLIAEISGGYDLFIPLILTSTVSFGTVRIFEKYSIYSKRIAKNGDLLTHDSDRAAMTLLQTRDLIRDKYPKVLVSDTLRKLVEAVKNSDAAVVAVLGEDGSFQGMVDVSNVRKSLFRTDRFDSEKVYNLMESAPEVIAEDEKVEDVMRKFESTQAWRLPVTGVDGKYLGFISKSRLLMAYRKELKEIISED